MYSDCVRRLVAELPNSGFLEGATHHARVENPVCGDVVELFLRIEEGQVQSCRFRASGCPAAIAASAAVTILSEDMPVQSCLKIGVEDVLNYLGGLPTHKKHGAELAVEVLKRSLTAF